MSQHYISFVKDVEEHLRWQTKSVGARIHGCSFIGQHKTGGYTVQLAWHRLRDMRQGVFYLQKGNIVATRFICLRVMSTYLFPNLGTFDINYQSGVFVYSLCRLC